MIALENPAQNLINSLQTLITILDLPTESTLVREAIAISDFLTKTTFQIAVFAPFNHGKSTLLNALLGQKSLPIDLVPSTGAAIKIKYGETIATKIIFQDGTEKIANNTKILQEYAVLDGDLTMQNDIQTVEVTCNYPLLKPGVELLDLPGTNDREDRDNLVKEKLLTADLIIHVLDARKLMTLLEREKLRDWLQARGIHTVIFVVNFLNLLEPEDRKKVYNRLKFVAESFRSELPAGISNLYRVDALPALRARLKGDYHTVMETGLTDLETALQSIIKAHKNKLEIRLTRIQAIGEQLITEALAKKEKLQQKIAKERQKKQQKNEIEQKAAQLIQQGLQRSISEFESWLYLPNLLKAEQASLAIAIQEDSFINWRDRFKITVTNYQQEITEWLIRSQEFFPIDKSLRLQIDFLQAPQIEKSNNSDRTENTKSQNTNNREDTTVKSEIDRIFERTMKTILSGNSREFLNDITKTFSDRSNTDKPKNNETATKNTKSLSQLYAEAASNYLTSFSQQTFKALKEYQTQAEKSIGDRSKSVKEDLTPIENQLNLLEKTTHNLQQKLHEIPVINN